MSDLGIAPTPTPPVLSLRGVGRTYKLGDGGTLNVLHDVDLDVRAGEIVGLIGPSGSGKSSLLHAAGLLEKPSAGRVILDGVDCTTLNEAARTRLRLGLIGFIYQFHHLLAEFSALDNVALPQEIAGATKAAGRGRATELLSHLGLAERLGHQPAQLSGGEQQRVAIARALANDPRLVIADEPTGNLDPATTERVFATLIKMVREEGAGVLVATHNLALIRHMDRVLTLQDGKLVDYTE